MATTILNCEDLEGISAWYVRHFHAGFSLREKPRAAHCKQCDETLEVVNVEA